MYTDDNAVAVWRAELIEWGPRILFAILILVVTHFVAKGVQWGIARAVDKMPILKRDRGVDENSIGKELGRLGYWIVWLVGLVAAMQPLGLSDQLAPVTELTNEIFAFIPKLFGAGLIFFAGLILGRIVGHIVEAFLSTLNLERLAGRAGLSLGEAPLAVDSEGEAKEGEAPARSSIAKASGATISAVIIILFAISALEILEIQAISEPATRMLETIADAIPGAIAALILLAIAYIVAKWVKTLIETVLPGLGFDKTILALGAMPANSQPSKIISSIAFIAVLLTAIIQAVDWLGGAATAAILLQVTALGGKVIFGTIIIVVGLFLSRILSKIVGDSTGEGNFAETVVKYAIIALFTAIGLTFMGLANEIVILAFGLILGSAAIAAALAFGLGGRDAAARMLDEWQQDAPPPPRPPRPKRIRKATKDDDDSQPPLV